MFQLPLNEQTVGRYTATLLDETGAVVPFSSLTGLELWLYEVRTRAILNSRGVFGGAGQNVLNANNVTVDVNGLLTWQIQTADTVILGTRDLEVHRAAFRATWGSPAKTMTHEFQILVTNLRSVV